MKHLLNAFILCLTLLIGSIDLKAQQQFIGIKFGAGPVSIVSSELNNPSSGEGISTGLLYNYLAKSRFTFGTELLYERRGYADRYFLNMFDPSGPKATVPTYFEYLCLPVSAGYTFGNRFHVKPSVGVCPGILVRATTTYDATGIYQPDFANNYKPTYKTVDIKNTASDFNFSVFADISFGYNISRQMDVSLSTRFQEGLTPILKSDSKPFWNNDLYLCLGLRYCLTK